jgi:hypothetical protein
MLVTRNRPRSAASGGAPSYTAVSRDRCPLWPGILHVLSATELGLVNVLLPSSEIASPQHKQKQTNSVALSPRANYTD